MDSHFDEDQWSVGRSQLIFSYSVSTQRILPKTLWPGNKNNDILYISFKCQAFHTFASTVFQLN